MITMQKATFSLLVLVLGAALVSGCRRSATPTPRSPVLEKSHVRVQLGLDGAQDAGCWNLLQVEAENRGVDFQGVLEVLGYSGFRGNYTADPVTYRLQIELPRDTWRHFQLPVRPENWSALRLTFRQKGFVRKLFLEDLGVSPPVKLRILQISPRSMDLSPLRKWLEGYLVEDEEVKAFRAGGEPLFSLVNIASPDLPTNFAAYEPFQLILLRSSLAGAEPEAFAALHRWVERGGTIIAFPGSEWAGGVPPELDELLGITHGDPEKKLPDALAGFLGAEARVFYRDLLPSPEARWAERGLSIRHRAGVGSTTTFTVSPVGNTFPESLAAPEFYAQLLEPVARACSFSGDFPGASQVLEQVAPLVLHEMSDFRVPSVGSVAGGLLVYLLLGFLVPAFVFGRLLRRREWTFLVMVLAAGLATLGIYRYGLLSALESSEIEEISILRAHRDGKTAEATSLLGVISPHLDRVDLESGEGGPGNLEGALRHQLEAVAGRPGTQFLGSSSSSVTLEGDAAGRFRVPRLTLYPHAMRIFRYDYQVSLENLVSVKFLPGRADELAVRIQNPGTEPLRPILVRGEHFKELRTVLPGKEEVIRSKIDTDVRG